MAIVPCLLTTTQLLSFVDQNRICQLLSDSANGVPIDPATLSTNQYLNDIMNAACQKFMTAAVVDARYTPDEMVGLAGDIIGGALPALTTQAPANIVGGTSVPGIGAYLRQVVAWLVWGGLVDRKKNSTQGMSSFEELAPSWQQGEIELERLRLGERIFQVGNAAQAGLPNGGLLPIQVGVSACQQVQSKRKLFGNLAQPRFGGSNWGGPGNFG